LSLPAPFADDILPRRSFTTELNEATGKSQLSVNPVSPVVTSHHHGRRITGVEFLSAIEHSAFSTWVREDSSFWVYPGILFMHTVGVALVVGISAMIDLRLLGFARTLPVAPLERFFPVVWTGFWINAVSGTILLAANATAMFTNPVFYVKMLLIAIGVVDMALLRRVVFRAADPEKGIPASGKFLAAASLVLWFGATTAGRLMPYLGAVSGAPGVTNKIGG
jgi:hypothetical protein